MLAVEFSYAGREEDGRSVELGFLAESPLLLIHPKRRKFSASSAQSLAESQGFYVPSSEDS